MHFTLVLFPVISFDFILHHIWTICNKLQEDDTLCFCYLFFPLFTLFEMLGLVLCDEGLCCCKVVSNVHQQLEEIVHDSCVCL